MAIELTEQQKLLAAAGVGIVVVGVLLYMIYDSQSQIQKARTEIITYRKKIVKAQQRIKEIPALREKRYALTNAVEEYVKILPDGREVEALLDTLSDLRKEAEVELISFRITREARRGKGGSRKFEKHTRQAKLVGEFFNIAKFINLLERYKRFMSVESFSLKPKEGKMLDVDLKFSTYTYQRK
ncbi:MAG: type 4a pilus biogenesis protein PilO [Planctomycetes bacterium]|nr:type 4a pilus biogenesis protein PilO [Planctomycetota bacterium]